MLRSPAALSAVESEPIDSLPVLVCGFEPFVRAGIRAACDGAAGVRVADEVLRLRPAAVALSFALSNRFGANDLREVVSWCSVAGVPVVAIMDPDDAEALLIGIAVGIRGCVSKFVVDDLATALREVSLGRSFLSAELTSILFTSGASGLPVATAEAPVDLSELSDWERGVLELLGTGLSNLGIAGRLCIKETTVRSHVHHIKVKLDLQNRTKAIIVGYWYNELRGRSFGGDPVIWSGRMPVAGSCHPAGRVRGMAVRDVADRLAQPVGDRGRGVVADGSLVVGGADRPTGVTIAAVPRAIVLTMAPDRLSSRHSFKLIGCSTMSKPSSAPSVSGLSGVMPVRVEYSIDLFDGSTILFDGSTIDRLGGHFRRLVQQATDNPDRPVALIGFRLPEEQRRLLRTPADTAVPVPTATLGTLQPTVVAAEDPRDTCLTYAELDARATALAAELTAHGAGHPAPRRCLGCPARCLGWPHGPRPDYHHWCGVPGQRRLRRLHLRLRRTHQGCSSRTGRS